MTVKRGRGPSREVAKCHYTHNASTTSNTQAVILGLSTEQIDKILTLLEAPKSSKETLSSKSVWLLDSGASCHMVCNSAKLNNQKQIPAISVSLLRRAQTWARATSLDGLRSKFLINEILFIAKLNNNLILIARLCKNSHFIVTFFDDFYVIQDYIARALIGAGK